MLSALAELEEKRSIQKVQIEAKIQKAMARGVEVVADAAKEKKALDDFVALKKIQIDENVETIRSKAENECSELREQLDAMEKEVKERKANIQEEAGILRSTSAASTTPAPAMGSVSLDVAPGYLLHSSHVDRTFAQTMLASSGVSIPETETMTQIFMNIMNAMATRIEPPVASAAAPSTQPDGQGPKQNADLKGLEAESQQQLGAEDVDFTEGSTDSPAEAKAANVNEPPTKIKQKISNKERDAKNVKGKGIGKEIIKATDKDKEKK